jgi:hypothetical protein
MDGQSADAGHVAPAPLNVRHLLDLLRANPVDLQVRAQLIAALRGLPRPEAGPVEDEALRITNWDPDLLREWEPATVRPFPATVLPRVSTFGGCRCSGRFDRCSVEIRLLAAGRLVVLDDVPQGVCGSCGTRVYRPNILAAIEAVMRGYAIPGLAAPAHSTESVETAKPARSQ